MFQTKCRNNKRRRGFDGPERRKCVRLATVGQSVGEKKGTKSSERDMEKESHLSRSAKDLRSRCSPLPRTPRRERRGVCVQGRRRLGAVPSRVPFRHSSQSTPPFPGSLCVLLFFSLWQEGAAGKGGRRRPCFARHVPPPAFLAIFLLRPKAATLDRTCRRANRASPSAQRSLGAACSRSSGDRHRVICAENAEPRHRSRLPCCVVRTQEVGHIFYRRARRDLKAANPSYDASKARRELLCSPSYSSPSPLRVSGDALPTVALLLTCSLTPSLDPSFLSLVPSDASLS